MITVDPLDALVAQVTKKYAGMPLDKVIAKLRSELAAFPKTSASTPPKPLAEQLRAIFKTRLQAGEPDDMTDEELDAYLDAAFRTGISTEDRKAMLATVRLRYSRRVLGDPKARAAYEKKVSAALAKAKGTR